MLKENKRERITMENENTPKFKKKTLLYWEEDQDGANGYWLQAENLSEIPDGSFAAVYELKQTGQIRVWTSARLEGL